MHEIGQPDWEKVRQIIRNWLVSQNRSIRALAHEAGIQPSVISRFLKGETSLDFGSAAKLFPVLHQDMNPVEQQVFLQVTELMPLVMPLVETLFRDYLIVMDPQSLTASPAREKIGNRLLSIGSDLDDQSLWDKAIPWFRKAEVVLGSSSPQAVRAASEIAMMYAELGDFEKAQEEITRVQHTYGSAINLETEGKLYSVRGWLHYYQGNFVESEKWFKYCLRIAEQSGNERIGETAQHFLARIYFEWGEQTLNQRQKPKAEVWFHKAGIQFDKAYQLHMKGEFLELNRAYDLFRKAQLLRAQHKWQDAQQLRNTARQIFDKDIAIFSIDLEEARLALEDGDIRTPKRKAEAALRRWAQAKKTGGMADALQVLGSVARVQGKLDQAFEIYLAALCVYPYQGTLNNRQLWEDVKDLKSDIIQQTSRKVYQHLIQNLQEVVDTRTGYFSYLNYISANRSVDIARIINELSLEKLGK